MIRRLLAGGALAYLTKPLDLSDLGAIIESLPARLAPGRIQATPTVGAAARQPADDQVTNLNQPPEARL